MSSWWLPESPPGRTSVEGDGLEGFPREVGVSTQKGPCLVGAGEKSAGQRLSCFTTCPGCFLRQLCFHGLGANESWMKVLGIPLKDIPNIWSSGFPTKRACWYSLKFVVANLATLAQWCQSVSMAWFSIGLSPLPS